MSLFFLSFFTFWACRTDAPSASTPPNEQSLQELIELEAILESPEKAAEICQKTKIPGVIKQCSKIKQRPHLYMNSKNKQSTHQKRTLSYKSPLRSTPAKSNCPQDNYSCMLQAAHDASAQAERTGQCRSIKNKVWQAECFFEVAEEGFKKKKLSYTEAADLCTFSQDFVCSCLQHLSLLMVDHARNLQTHTRHASEIRSFWKTREANIGRDMEGIYWVTALDIFMSSQTRFDNQVFTELPVEAHPHIWSAMARKIVHTQTQKKSLAQWTERLISWKEGKTVLTFARQRQNVHIKGTKNMGRKNTSFKTVMYSEDHDRILGQNTEEEIQISLLISAKIYQKCLEWLNEAKTSNSSRVKATL